MMVRLIACLVVLLASTCPAAEPPPPNVLFVLCDDLRPDAVGCYGSKHVKTPRIDALAADGVRLIDNIPV
jgi:hypothetical protein